MAESCAGRPELPLFSVEEVQQHNSEKDFWIIHRGKVYDVSEFLERHPGGKDILLRFAGKDVTKVMTQDDLHRHTNFAYGWLGKYLIGRLKGEVRKLFFSSFETSQSPLFWVILNWPLYCCRWSVVLVNYRKQYLHLEPHRIEWKVFTCSEYCLAFCVFFCVINLWDGHLQHRIWNNLGGLLPFVLHNFTPDRSAHIYHACYE